MANPQSPGRERIGPLTQRLSRSLDRLLGVPLRLVGVVIDEVEGKNHPRPMFRETLDRRVSRAILAVLVVGIFVALYLLWRFWDLRA